MRLRNSTWTTQVQSRYTKPRHRCSLQICTCPVLTHSAWRFFALSPHFPAFVSRHSDLHSPICSLLSPLSPPLAGCIDAWELKEAMKSLGQNPTDEEVPSPLPLLCPSPFSVRSLDLNARFAPTSCQHAPTLRRQQKTECRSH